LLIQRYDYKAISRKTEDGKRHYCLPDGSKVPSVTTILEATKPESSKKALFEWRRRVGEKQAQEITTEAASRGTRMHTYLEHYVKDGQLRAAGSNPYAQQSHKMAEIVIKEGLANATEIWGMEVPLYCSGLYAGTSDCVGLWKTKPAILDFKQTNKPKKREWIEDYFLQLAAYALAHNETHGTDIKNGVILMCSKDFQFQQFEITDTEFQKYIDAWLNRVEQYYRINT
jgi:genome maintenance exonuclease 1